MPARTPTGMLRKTLQTTRISAVPVISIGGTLNARMYDTPMTVPGIANDSMVPNSNAVLSGEALPRQQVGGQDSERRGQRRGDRRQLHGRPERIPGGAGPDEAVRSPFDAERLHVVLERERVVAAPGFDEAAGERHRVDHDRHHDPRQRDAVARAGARRSAARSAAPASPLPETRRVDLARRAPSAARRTRQARARAARCPSVAARPWSSCAPTTEKKISVDSTPKLPPSRIGLPKSAIDSMKLMRNALARPGRISGSETSTNVRQRSGAQRLRRLLQRRRHALDDADQHEEGDRREREDLRDENALHAVDPARRLDAERPLEELVDESGASEEQDQPEADHERRRDDRQHRQARAALLYAEARAGDDQRKREAEHRAAERAQHREQRAYSTRRRSASCRRCSHAPDLCSS